jgi:excisionase family DNA binding protein
MLVGASEAADYLGISKSTLYNWRYQGKVPYHKLYGLLRFDLSELRQLIKSPEAIIVKDDGGSHDKA